MSNPRPRAALPNVDTLLPGIQPKASEAIARRVEELQAWLKEHAPECVENQKHLDANTAERAYWHYGYLAALLDVQRLLAGQKRDLH